MRFFPKLIALVSPVFVHVQAMVLAAVLLLLMAMGGLILAPIVRRGATSNSVD